MFSSTDTVVFNFPVLNTFKLKDCKWSNVSLVEIHSPTLTIFKCETARDAVVNDGYSIKICGASIEEFESSGGFPENITLYESVVLKAAFLYEFLIKSESDEEASKLQKCLQVRKFLKEFSSVTALQLSYSMFEAIKLSIQDIPLPQYDRLQRLAMCVWPDTKLLFEFLHSAPSLRFLNINGSCEEFDCDEVEPVPYCVLSRLEEVELVYMQEKPLIRLAKFFLKNGAGPKKVCLCRHRSESFSLPSYCFQLLKFPRATTVTHLPY